MSKKNERKKEFKGTFPADPALMAGDEEYKEMMVVVKRGSGIDYEEKKHSPFLETYGDIRDDFPGMTWKEIRTAYIDKWGAADEDEEDEEDEDEEDEEDYPTEMDVYKHVDEYAWTPFHLNHSP